MTVRLITAVWCTSCLIMRPRYQMVLAQHPQWTFEEIDFDSDPDTISGLKPGKTLPVAIIEKDGKELGRIIGEKSLPILAKLFEVFE